MKVSYSCSDLIEECKQDLFIFGNVDVYAMVEEKQGLLLLTNYDHIVDEDPLTEEEKKKYKYIVEVPLQKVLKVFEIEDNIFTEYELIQRALITELGLKREDFSNVIIDKLNNLN